MRLAIEIDQYIKTLRADHLAETAALKEENAAFKAVSVALQARIRELESELKNVALANQVSIESLVRQLHHCAEKRRELEEIDKWRSEGGVDPQTNKMWLTRHMKEKAEALSVLWDAQKRIKELEWVQNEIHILRAKIRELEKEE